MRMMTMRFEAGRKEEEGGRRMSRGGVGVHDGKDDQRFHSTADDGL